VSGVHGGGDNNSRVGAASHSESAAAVRGVVAVERKAGRRRSGEEGVREARRSTVTVA